MFDFNQYLGFLAFLTILTIGFWLMIFLVSFIPYWIVGHLSSILNLKAKSPLQSRVRLNLKTKALVKKI